MIVDSSLSARPADSLETESFVTSRSSIENNTHDAIATKEGSLSKVPEVVLLFWIIKIAATTLGETGGDAVSMSMNLGYLVSPNPRHRAWRLDRRFGRAWLRRCRNRV